MIIQTTLEAPFAGELIAPDHPDYDGARQLYNGVHDKRPALIARCTSAGDVQRALALAREHELIVAVRGGGHSIPGYSSCDGGLVIDVGPMKTIEIDVERRSGRFGAGLTWGELDAATQEHGLAVTGGRVTHTGVAGLTLGSGSGWLERKCGITCDSLVSVEVVTAHGRVVRASAEENPELFWGLKGGGGNFGVVTEFEFGLHAIGPIVYAGMTLHPRDAAPALLRFYRDFMADAPDEVCGGVSLLTAPPEDVIPEAARGRPAVGLIVLYTGDAREGERIMRPLVDWGEPWLRLVQPMPYVLVQQMVDGAPRATTSSTCPTRRSTPWSPRSRRPPRPSPACTCARSAAPSPAPIARRWRSRSRTPAGSTCARRCGWTRARRGTRRRGRAN
jgi:FAD/FMN-containing dehydrogenase